MCVIFKLLVFGISIPWVVCTIDGLSYMDPIKLGQYRNTWPPGEDPCNPLYWYPRNIPEYCSLKTTPNVVTNKPQPIPVPIPVPLPPQNIPMPVPPLPPSMPIPSQPIPFPQFIPPPMPLSFGIPLDPTNPMLPVTGSPYPAIQHSYPFQSLYRQQAGMVPGLPGLVSPDGGINILPFSDAYSDLLERHKQKTIRKQLQKLLDKYERYPTRNRKRHKNCRRKMYLD